MQITQICYISASLVLFEDHFKGRGQQIRMKMNFLCVLINRPLVILSIMATAFYLLYMVCPLLLLLGP